MMIDQTWTARDVTQKMISKDDVEMDVNWCIIEKLPDLNMGKGRNSKLLFQSEKCSGGLDPVLLQN